MEETGARAGESIGGRPGGGDGVGDRLRIGAEPGRGRRRSGEPPFPNKVIFVAGEVGLDISVTQSDPDAGTGVAVHIGHQVADLSR